MEELRVLRINIHDDVDTGLHVGANISDFSPEINRTDNGSVSTERSFTLHYTEMLSTGSFQTIDYNDYLCWHEICNDYFVPRHFAIRRNRRVR
jgi:hypothetical protein